MIGGTNEKKSQKVDDSKYKYIFCGEKGNFPVGWDG